jgi:lytic murein transglycosylase
VLRKPTAGPAAVPALSRPPADGPPPASPPDRRPDTAPLSPQRVLSHKRARTLALGPHMRLAFEDRLTLEHLVRTIARAERIMRGMPLPLFPWPRRVRHAALMAAAALAACATTPTPAPSPPSQPTSSDVIDPAKRAGPTHADALQQRLEAWLAGFRAQARQAGIDEATLQAAFSEVRYLPRIVELDRAQPEFTRSVWDYLDRAVSAQRVARGLERMAQARADLDAAATRYGVAAELIAAIWGIESNFGSDVGSTPVIDALATLAVDGRREAWARDQLLGALKILQRGDIERTRLVGSWAGAMGQTQFIPSAFLAYAVDADGDGRRDLWTSMADVAASTAHFLARSGWQPGQPGRSPVGRRRPAHAGRHAAARAERCLGLPARRRARPGLPRRPQFPRPAALQQLHQLRAGGRPAGAAAGRRQRRAGGLAARSAAAVAQPGAGVADRAERTRLRQRRGRWPAGPRHARCAAPLAAQRGAAGRRLPDRRPVATPGTTELKDGGSWGAWDTAYARSTCPRGDVAAWSAHDGHWPIRPQRLDMRNPWTTKNPFMSAWLSAANRVAGSARGQATAAAKRQVATVQAEAAKQVVDFWSGKKPTASAPGKRKR